MVGPALPGRDVPLLSVYHARIAIVARPLKLPISTRISSRLFLGQTAIGISCSGDAEPLSVSVVACL